MPSVRQAPLRLRLILPAHAGTALTGTERAGPVMVTIEYRPWPTHDDLLATLRDARLRRLRTAATSLTGLAVTHSLAMSISRHRSRAPSWRALPCASVITVSVRLAKPLPSPQDRPTIATASDRTGMLRSA